MASFALYNYEFELNIPSLHSADAFTGKTEVQTAKENFEKRQEIFSAILQKDYLGEIKIPYTPKRSKDSRFLRIWCSKPRKGLFVYRLIKNHIRKLHDVNEVAHDAPDYLGCTIIIDNAPNHQVLAIEDKPSAIGKLSTTDDILARAFNALLEKEYLRIRLEHIYEPSTFWDIVGNNADYPKGFSKVEFNFPQQNLARFSSLQSKLQYIMDETRGGFGSGVQVCMKKNVDKEGPMVFDQNNETQVAYADLAASCGGDNSIVLYPVGAKKISVGKNNYKHASISDTTLLKLKDGSPDMFDETPFDKINAILRKEIPSLPNDKA